MEDCHKQNEKVDIIPIASQKEIKNSVEENSGPPDGGCQVRKTDVIYSFVKLIVLVNSLQFLHCYKS